MAYGDSDSSYGGVTEEQVFQGMCQGNGGGPAVWASVSICLVRLMYKRNHDSVLRSALSNILEKLIGFLYVDNTEFHWEFPNWPVMTPWCEANIAHFSTCKLANSRNISRASVLHQMHVNHHAM